MEVVLILNSALSHEDGRRGHHHQVLPRAIVGITTGGGRHADGRHDAAA